VLGRGWSERVALRLLSHAHAGLRRPPLAPLLFTSQYNGRGRSAATPSSPRRVARTPFTPSQHALDPGPRPIKRWSKPVKVPVREPHGHRLAFKLEAVKALDGADVRQLAGGLRCVHDIACSGEAGERQDWLRGAGRA
jgi:hypothetical protein